MDATNLLSSVGTVSILLIFDLCDPIIWGCVGTAHAQPAHDREKLGNFCYNWQYSCLYRPYYTPTTLDSPITQSGFFSSRQLQRYREVLRTIYMAQPEFPRSFLLKTSSLVTWGFQATQWSLSIDNWSTQSLIVKRYWKRYSKMLRPSPKSQCTLIHIPNPKGANPNPNS